MYKLFRCRGNERNECKTISVLAGFCCNTAPIIEKRYLIENKLISIDHDRTGRLCSSGVLLLAVYFREHDKLGRFLTIVYKESNIGDFLFAFLHTKPYCNGIYSHRKEFAHKGGRGGKFNAFKVDPISKGADGV